MNKMKMDVCTYELYLGMVNDTKIKHTHTHKHTNIIEHFSRPLKNTRELKERQNVGKNYVRHQDTLEVYLRGKKTNKQK